MIWLLVSNLVLLLLCPPVGFAAQWPFSSKLEGRVVDQAGTFVSEALVIASGAGFNGGATTDKDGYFLLKEAGMFISIRKAGWEPQVKKNQNRSEVLVVLLQAAGEVPRVLPQCPTELEARSKYIGGSLMVRPVKKKFKGPKFGEHDSHGTLSFDKATLHVFSGYAWHAGLPQESRLADSEQIEVRS